MFYGWLNRSKPASFVGGYRRIECNCRTLPMKTEQDSTPSSDLAGITNGIKPPQIFRTDLVLLQGDRFLLPIFLEGFLRFRNFHSFAPPAVKPHWTTK
jgi:hypothetical protein